MMHHVIGIDLGRAGIDIAFPPADARTKPHLWKSTVKLLYSDSNWWQALVDMIADDAIIAAEPTGAHLLAPIANIIHTYRPEAHVYQVDHRLTGAYRAAHVSNAKNDRLDAITLCLIANDIRKGEQMKGIRKFDAYTAEALTSLRLLVNDYFRLTKESTRIKNRVQSLAFHIFPSFAKSGTYRRAVEFGAVTIEELRDLYRRRPPEYGDGRAYVWLKKMIAKLPEIPTNPLIADQIREHQMRLKLITQQRADTRRQIKELVTAEPFKTVTERWSTIPGFSYLFAAALHIPTYGQADKMRRDDFVAALGANPLKATSGTGDTTRLSKRGYTPAKACLHIWTLLMLSSKSAPKNPVRDAYIRYTAQNKQKPLTATRARFARMLNAVASDPNGWAYDRNDQDDPDRDITDTPDDEAIENEQPPAADQPPAQPMELPGTLPDTKTTKGKRK